MQNAKSFDPTSRRRVLVVGEAGSGKTTQIWSLPGRKFAYVFDPNALHSLEGCDLDYEAFTPDFKDLNISAQTLKAGVGDRPSRKTEPVTYRDWEKDFDGRMESGFFNNYDWLVFDSFTTWAETVMDRVMYLNGRLGKQPEQADWGAQIQTIQNVFRVLTNLPVNFYCTGHSEVRQDELTKRVYGRIMMPGRLRQRLPLLFTDIFPAHCDSDAKRKRYLLQTVPDRENPVARTSLKDLNMYEDVTIEDVSKAQSVGLGALLTGVQRPTLTKKAS